MIRAGEGIEVHEVGGFERFTTKVSVDPALLKLIRSMRTAIMVLAVILGVVIGYLILADALAPKVHAAPYICFDPSHAQDVLCAGAYSQRPPGYSLQDPGTWQPWPKYSPVPGGSY